MCDWGGGGGGGGGGGQGQFVISVLHPANQYGGAWRMGACVLACMLINFVTHLSTMIILYK